MDLELIKGQALTSDRSPDFGAPSAPDASLSIVSGPPSLGPLQLPCSAKVFILCFRGKHSNGPSISGAVWNTAARKDRIAKYGLDPRRCLLIASVRSLANRTMAPL
jgi:hypothetical protein